MLHNGSTIPFIARYRKEQTNNLDEVEIALIQDLANKFKEIEKRKSYILKIIKDKNVLTESLEDRINKCWDFYKLEDYYLPYKTKRITKGERAKKAGLIGIAKTIMSQRDEDSTYYAKKYKCIDYNTTKLVIEGALHIVAEWINENEIVRERLRKSFIEHSLIITKEIKRNKNLNFIQQQQKLKFKDILNYSQRLSNCSSSRLLAILRAEKEGFIKIKIEPKKEYSIQWLEKFYCKNNNTNTSLVKAAINDTYKRLLQPSLETETKQLYKKIADKKAIQIFEKNLKTLLLAPPIGAKSILALDPGFKSGCKLVCLSKSGKLMYNTTIYPHPPQNNAKESAIHVTELINKYDIEAIAIGDGTAGRETEEWIKNIKINNKVKIFIVKEDGASIYSASKIGRDEFPDYDLTVRGAVSIGRRLADPLAELVKIDPKSLGIGQYQHDVNQVELKKSLDFIVESCVNRIGVNINTASKYLLSYISGLGPKLAESIVEYRETNGLLKSKEELKKAPKMGKKAFEQSAGFIKVPNSKNILDNSFVHPENYNSIQNIAKDLNVDVNELITNTALMNKLDINNYTNEHIGYHTLTAIINELKKTRFRSEKRN